MNTYDSIKDIDNIIQISPEYADLLELLERVNPCDQSYDIEGNSLVISYRLKLNLLNFFGSFPLYKKVRIVGLPISLCEKGYFGDVKTVKDIIKKKKGLTLLLNGEKDLGCKNLTLSTFVFHNSYSSFEDYLEKLRSPYRRRILKALAKRINLKIESIENSGFNEVHYSLYRDTVLRSENPLEILPMEFFQSCEADLYEVSERDTNKIIAFFQLKNFGDDLYFLFCGFNKDGNDAHSLYYNILIKIVEIAIAKGARTINFGQTSEESKLKIGCKEEKKHLCIHHSNPILNKVCQSLLPFFSYRPYNIYHNVFKKE